MMLTIRVIPNSSKTEFVSWMADGSLKIRLAAPPVDGAANRELVSFLAKSLKLAKSDVEITNGLISKKKTIRLPMEREALSRMLSVELGLDEPLVQPKMF